MERRERGAKGRQKGGETRDTDGATDKKGQDRQTDMFNRDTERWRHGQRREKEVRQGRKK